MEDDLAVLASGIPALYADLSGLRMALVTGSVARGLADSASDLDVYLYWEGVDREALASTPRCGALGARRVVGMPTVNGFFEKYRVGARFLDVESVDIGALERVAGALEVAEVPDGAIKLVAGLRDARAIVGADELARWQARFSFTDAVAAAEIAVRGRRLLSPRALFDLTYVRGDTLSFAARLSGVLLEAVALLGAANRVFVPVDDPKWLPWHIGRLTHVPPDLVVRVHDGLTNPSAANMDDLDRLLLEILDIVDEQVSRADTRTARFVLGLRPLG